MKLKFFSDDHNARFVWSWVDGQYVTDDKAEIENLTGLGLRFETVEENKAKPVKKTTKKAT